MTEAEANRYIAMPGQALSYKVGQMEIERWRGEAAKRRGFRLPDFHDRLLGVGSLPLPALRREVEAARRAVTDRAIAQSGSPRELRGPMTGHPPAAHNHPVPTPLVYSWSAGKDSAFGLWTLLRDPAYEVRALLTTLTETYNRVSISGVREELLDRQADMLGLPLIKVRIPPACPNDLYEQRMVSTLGSQEFRGIDHVAFSDLFLEDVRAYREDRLAQVGKHGVFPLWHRHTTQLAQEIIAQGFRAMVVCLDPRVIDPSFAGRAFDLDFLADLPEEVDPCGENGEFHTFVWDAPAYRVPIRCRTGDVVTRDGFVYCDVLLEV